MTVCITHELVVDACSCKHYLPDIREVARLWDSTPTT
jgi:hypothetical protein